MSKLDLLLVNPSITGTTYQSLFSVAAIEVPVWAGLIAQFARNKGYSVGLLDARALGTSIEDAAQYIKDVNATLTVFVIYGHHPSASTQSMPDAISLCKSVHGTSNQKIMFMGGHPSALSEESLMESGADYICVGEGPYTIVETIEMLKNNGQPAAVDGLCYISDNIFVQNPLRPVIVDLDHELPGVAWDLLPMDKYRAHNWHCFDNIDHRQPYASLQTSLGCPFKCSFCCINAPFGKPRLRCWSPEVVIKELDILVYKYGVRNIKIPDEMFVLNKSHVLGLCDLIIDREYDVNIWAYARIDTIKDRYLEKLKKAGFNWLSLGIESGSSFVRDGAEKTIDHSAIKNVVAKVKSYDIAIVANYIFGLPDDTLETMQETLDLAILLNAEYSSFYSAMAYPGSSLHAWARQNNVSLPEGPEGPGWIGYSQHAYETFPLSSDHLTRGEILRFRDKAHIEYFEGDRYLSMLEKKYGTKTRKHVEGLNAIKLARKYA